MTRSSKVIILTLLILGGVIAAIYLWVSVLRPRMWVNRIREESIAALKSAATPEELTEVVDWGIFLSFPDGSWMALRYADTHGFGNSSLTVVRDSGGQWFESRHHYCGTLAFYRDVRRSNELKRELGQPETIITQRQFHGIPAVAESKNLDEARKQLLMHGFTKMETR